MGHSFSSPLHLPLISTGNTLSLVKSLRENHWVLLLSPAIDPFTEVSPIVRQIENYPSNTGDVPKSPIVISDCGELSPDDPSLTEAAEAPGGDPFEDYPDDEDRDVQEPTIALEIAKAVRDIGNKLFKEGKPDEAFQKYISMVVTVLYEKNLYMLSRIPTLSGRAPDIAR